MMPTESDSQTFLNDAFISYSRKDKKFAVRLEKALRNYKPPKVLNLPRRNLVVFRDEEDFTGVEYHGSLEQHLNNSAKMIVICSPHARESEYVNDEIRRFAKLYSPSDIIPVLLSGIPNNEAKPGQEEEMAFPHALFEIREIKEGPMPLAASYIGFDSKKDKVNKGVFYGAWYKILADLYDITRNEIEERDKKRQARQRNILIGAVSAIFLIVTSLAVYAWVQKVEAGKRMRIAQARQLAAQSMSFTASFPKRSLLLAIASIFRTSKAGGIIISSAEQALRNSFSVIGGIELRGHVEKITSIAFSPDGKKLAAGGFDETVRIWDTGNPKAEPVVLRSRGLVTSVVFSPDGNKLASGGSDKTVRIWDPGNPKAEPVILRGHEGIVTTVAFSPDGKRLASADEEGSVRIWDPDYPRPDCIVLRGYGGIVQSVAFSPDGKSLASDDGDTVRIWNVGNPEGEPIVLRGHEKFVSSVAFSPDGKKLASGGWDETVRIWDSENPRVEPVVLRGHEGVVSSVAFSSDGKRLASGSWDRTVRIWNAGDFKAEPVVLRGHEGVVEFVAFSPDGKRLASAGRSESAGPVQSTVRVWTIDVDKLCEVGCTVVGRNLTCEEWHQFFRDEPYSPICPDLPYPKDCGKNAKAR